MWEDLSFKDRSKLIELGASQGILDLSTIKHLYNINADGGYLKWKKEIAKHKGINIDNDNTYNYQAFFEEDPQRAWDMLKKDSKAHFTDKYKTVWHPTFSDESVYSGHKSKYNPQGLVGGHWEGNTFKMSDSLYNSPVSMDERQQYLIDNEPNGVSLLESNGTLPVYDGIPWGGVLPEVTITPQYSDGGSIHIAKNKRGTFKAQASRMGMSTQQAASQILANKDNYSPAMVKKAVFAHNFAHAYGGPLDNTFPEAINNLHIFEYGGEYGNGGKKNKYSFMDKLKMSMMNTIPLIPDPTTFNAPFDNVTGNVNDRTSSVAQVSYLLSRDKQQKLFEDYGYKRVYNDYGTVKRAAESKGYPIYQKNSDDVSRENLVPIGNADSDPFEVETTYKGKLMEVPTNWYAAPNKSLIEAGATRSTIYYNPDNGKYYQKAWDLNDYGGNGGSTADIFGKFLDTIGNPVVVTSGIQEVLPENINKVEKNYMLPYAKKHYLKKADNGHWGYVAPDVIIYGHKHAEGGFGDGGSLESDKDNLLAPIIKYYEDSSPYLSIEDQNTFAKGGQMKKARQAVDYFVNKGLTREQAAGLVGNLMRESGMNIGATNPNSGAYGLSQWLGSRKTRLFKRYGYHPTFEQQLDYIWDELNTSHRRGLQMLRASKTVDDAARNAFGYYEFSAGPEAAIRAMNSSGKNTKWKNPNGTYALNSGIKNAQMIFGEVPVTMNNAGDTLVLDTPESTPNIQPIISDDYAPVTTANLKELPTFGQEENNDSSIPSFGPQYLAQNLDKLGMTNPLNPFEKGYQLQSPKAIYANMQGLI